MHSRAAEMTASIFASSRLMAASGAVLRNGLAQQRDDVRARHDDAPAAVSPVPLLQVDNVSLEYRTHQRVVRATHRVSFDVHEADRFVLLGPSGCGKSTLLKAVGGFI